MLCFGLGMKFHKRLHKKGKLDARGGMNGKGVSKVGDWSETDTNIRKKQRKHQKITHSIQKGKM